MKILNRVGGTFLLLVLGIAAVLGFQTTTGRQIWDDLWAAVAAVLGYGRQAISRLSGSSPDGDASLAVAIAGVFVIVVLALLKKPVSVRAFTILVLAAAVGAFVLYNPTVVNNV